jgi:hypothetical protein
VLLVKRKSPLAKTSPRGQKERIALAPDREQRWLLWAEIFLELSDPGVIRQLKIIATHKRVCQDFFALRVQVGNRHLRLGVTAPSD